MKRSYAAMLLALALLAGLAGPAAAAEPEFVIDEYGALTAYNGPGGEVVIPEGVQQIRVGVFEDNTALTAVVIPESMVRLDPFVFAGCTNLTSVTLPAGLTDLGATTFDDTPWLDAMGDFPVVNGVLLDYRGSDREVTVPDGVAVIADDAFFNLNVTRVTLPEGVTRIGSNAFYQCTRLREVVIPSSVTEVGNGSFWGTPFWDSLGDFAIVSGILMEYRGSDAEVTVPEGVTVIEDCAFYYYIQCAGITSVTLPDGVKRIGFMAFSDCSRLETINLPDSLTEIDSHAFTGCESLRRLAIPASVRTIGVHAFHECPALEEVTYGGSREQWFQALADGDAFGRIDSGLSADTTLLFNVPPQNPFADVKAGDWFCEPVQWAVRENITTGTTATTFSPTQDCSVAQILTFLWRSEGAPEPANAVSGTAYYAKAAAWAAERGIVDEFQANAPCTRAAAVEFLWKAAGKPRSAVQPSFTDVEGSADLASAVAWAVEQGVTTGTSDTTFAPDAVCNRGQIVTFLYRAFAE